jgi:hypothetical protein
MHYRVLFPENDVENEFTDAEPEITDEEPLEAKLVADEEGITFLCRDCQQIRDIDCGLGCNCFVCEDCAMMYVTD